MEPTKQVIYIPGLGSKPEVQKQLPVLWSFSGLSVELQRIDWKASDYAERLEALGQRVISLATRGNVSIVGASAGGKTALSLFARYSEVIHRAVIVNAKIPPYDKNETWWQQFPNLVVSSEQLPNDLKHIEPPMYDRILCAFSETDETVTPDPNQPDRHPSILPGATMFAMPTDGHVTGIAYALTSGQERLITFIRQETSGSATPV